MFLLYKISKKTLKIFANLSQLRYFEFRFFKLTESVKNMSSTVNILHFCGTFNQRDECSLKLCFKSIKIYTI